MFTLANVEKVYSGKPGCMCGCRGKYSYAPGCEDRADRDDNVSARSVKIIFNKVMNHPKHKIEDNCAFVDTGSRNLVVYFKD
jgi:hypothetical protein